MFGSHRQGLMECSQPSGVDNIILTAETGHSSSEELSVAGKEGPGKCSLAAELGPCEAMMFTASPGGGWGEGLSSDKTGS